MRHLSSVACLLMATVSLFGQGLSGTEQTNLYTAVQAFQTALGRNV